MPEFGQNFRTQILIGLKADGLGEADKLAQEMLRVKRAIDAVREEFNQGALAADLYRKLLRPLIGDLNFLVKEYDAVVGAQDKLEASGAKAAAAFAKQEAAAEKAAMAHAGLAQKATLAVQAASDRINALLGKEVAEQLAAAERKAAIDAQAGARHEADLQQIHQAHLAFLAKEEAAEQASNARHEAELQGMHQRHLAFLAKEEAAEAAAAQRKADVESRAGATYEAELERVHQSHLAFLAREEAAEAAANARHEAELQQMHQSHQQFLASEAAAEQAAQSRHDGEMEQAYRKHMEFLAKDASAEEAAGARHEAEMAELANKHIAFLGQEEAAEAAAASRHEAELQRMHQSHLEFLAGEAAAEAQANARHDAEMGQAHQKHLEFLAKEQAADQAAIDALQRQKRQALEEIAAYEKRIADRRSERGFADAANVQVEALQRVGAQGQSNIELYKILEAQMAALIAKGSTRTNDDFDAMDRLKVKMREVWADMKVGAPAVRQITDDLAQQNTVINAGAAYTQHHAGSWHGFSDEVRTAQMAIKGTNDATQQSSSAMGKFGYGLLNVAHAAQDAQYGLGAVLNNIPLVTQSIVQAIPALERFSQKIGGPMGLAGAAMLLAVAGNSIYNNFDKIKVAFVGGTPFGPLADDVEKLTHRVEELDGAWLQSIEDVHAAAQAHRDLKNAAEAAKIAATPTEDQEKRKKSFMEAVKETPGGAQAAQNVARELEASRFFADPAGAVRAALESGRMPIRADLGITPERIGRTITDDRMYAIIKEQYFDKVIPALANQAIADMGRGEAPAFKDLMGRAMQHQRLGERDEAGNLINVFLRKLEQTSPEAQKKAEEVGQELEALDSEIEEGNRQWREYRERRKRAVTTHATAFGTRKAMGDKLEGDVRKLIAEGEEDPEKLKAGILADVERRIEESKTVPTALIKDVRDKVAERYVRKVVDELESNVAEGESITAAARKAIAEGEAKAKAKIEKPEIAHEVARMGREIGPDVHDAILRRAARKEPDEKIRGELAGQVGKAVAEGGVDPDIVADVAARIVADELGKVRAEQVAGGGVKPQTAKALLGERQVKAAGQEQAREKRVERVQDVAARPRIAREIMVRSGGMASPEQAEHGAEQYQALINRGVAPAVAENRVMTELARMIQQQRAIMDQTNAMMNGMANMLGQANQHLGMVGAQQGMMRGQMNNMRWQKPAPWNTIPGG